MEGPPIGTVLEDGSVFAVATPVRVESELSGPTPDEGHHADGIADELDDQRIAGFDVPTLAKFTVFELERVVLPSLPGTEEIAVPDTLFVSSFEDIPMGQTGLYLFELGQKDWRRGPYYTLGLCNGGYSLERVLHYAVTGEDDHWTARDVCGHTAYAWRRGEVDRSGISEACEAEYERIHSEAQAVPRDPWDRYGWPLRRYGMD